MKDLHINPKQFDSLKNKTEKYFKYKKKKDANNNVVYTTGSSSDSEISPPLPHLDPTQSPNKFDMKRYREQLKMEEEHFQLLEMLKNFTSDYQFTRK